MNLENECTYLRTKEENTGIARLPNMSSNIVTQNKKENTHK